jgi:hypothetical protein
MIARTLCLQSAHADDIIFRLLVFGFSAIRILAQVLRERCNNGKSAFDLFTTFIAIINKIIYRYSVL